MHRQLQQWNWHSLPSAEKDGYREYPHQVDLGQPKPTQRDAPTLEVAVVEPRQGASGSVSWLVGVTWMVSGEEWTWCWPRNAIDGGGGGGWQAPTTPTQAALVWIGMAASS